MKILVSISFYTPYISGLTICAKNYAEGLAAKGYEVTVLTTQHDKMLSHKEMVGDVQIHRIPYLFRFHKGFFMPTFFYKAWHFIRESDVVILNLPEVEGFLLAFLGWLLGKRVISLYHCEVVLPKSLINMLIEKILIFFNFLSLVFSTTIVTYTKDYADSTILLPIFSKKCRYILPPIQVPEVVRELQNELRRSIPKNTYVIGVAARIAAEKGVEYLFNAIPLIEENLKKKVTILVAGPKNPVGEHTYWKRLKPILEKYNKQIIFLGGISSDKLGSFYSVLDVLVLPSINKTEAFGIVQVEAMMMRIPVVVSDLPGVRIPTTLTGMGERSRIANVEDLADKISLVISNREKYSLKKEKIEEIFSYQKAIDTFERILVY